MIVKYFGGEVDKPQTPDPSFTDAELARWLSIKEKSLRYAEEDLATIRRPPLWERAFCFVLDALTKALDAFTGWIKR